MKRKVIPASPRQPEVHRLIASLHDGHYEVGRDLAFLRKYKNRRMAGSRPVLMFTAEMLSRMLVNIYDLANLLEEIEKEPLPE